MLSNCISKLDLSTWDSADLCAHTGNWTVCHVLLATAEVLHEAAREELHAAAFEAKSGRELEKSAAVKLQEAAELWDKVLEHPEGRCAYKYCRKDKEGNMLRCLPGSIACERLEPGQTS